MPLKRHLFPLLCGSRSQNALSTQVHLAAYSSRCKALAVVRLKFLLSNFDFHGTAKLSQKISLEPYDLGLGQIET